MGQSAKDLWKATDFKLSELLRFDLFAGVLGGAGGGVLAATMPEQVTQAVPVLAQLTGTIVGAVIAGVAIQAAFFDQVFLRKIRAVNRDPVYYLSPFLFTAILGVVASIALIVLSVIPATAPTWLLSSTAGLCAFLSVYTIFSLIPCLSTLVQFIYLKVDALDVPDDPDPR